MWKHAVVGTWWFRVVVILQYGNLKSGECKLSLSDCDYLGLICHVDNAQVVNACC